MAPLPANNTHRLFVDYTSGGFQHTMQFRFSGATTDLQAVGAAQTICTALADFMNANDDFFAARWQPQDAVFSLPVAWANVDGTDAGAAWAEDPESAMVTYCGRTTSGRRWRFEFFTIVKLSASWPATNRYQEGDDTDPDGIIATMRNAVTELDPPVVGIDNGNVIPYAYLNISKNGYWERKQRVS